MGAKKIKCAGCSNRGGRECNEDACWARGNEKILCAVVADGLGGHGKGDVASRAVVKAVQERLTAEKGKLESDTSFIEIARLANTNVLKMQTGECEMKSTMVLLYIDTDKMSGRWMHIGDSRLYHFEDGKIVFCTFDHSVPRMLAYQKEISMNDIRFHKDRNKVLKVVGTEPMCQPETGNCVLENDKRHVFLLCTDGFWEYVTEKTMEETLAEVDSPKQWIGKMLSCLKTVAPENNDNYSAIAVWIE